MPSDQVKRKLAAILAADVAGYSRLMGADEAGTLGRLKEYRRDLIDPKSKQHRGRIVKTMGDGILMEFPSVVDAVRCAIEVQQGMLERNIQVPQDKRIEFRIGINLGDVMVEGRDLYGDGVNIAARIETLAEPGGICISETVLDHARDKVSFEVADAGKQVLKNIARPIHVYRIVVTTSQPRAAPQAHDRELALPDKPSIAVLPFQNMSGDPEQEYFTDGMVEDIITALSQFPWLFVIARNSSFVYKGRSVDVKQVGRELGVRYVVEGSVRRSANRVRITAQLIDAITGAHLWADRVDGALEDIFDLQDRVTISVVGAIEPTLHRAELARSKRKPTDSLDAYDYYLRGLASCHVNTQKDIDAGLKLFYQSIAHDPAYASAYGMASWCYQRRKALGWAAIPKRDLAEAKRLALRAAELGTDDPVALYSAGFTLAYLVGDLDRGAALIERALALNPNLAAAWMYSALIHVYLGEPRVAIEHANSALRLSPLDTFTQHVSWSAITQAHFVAGRYEEAASFAEKTLREYPDFQPILRVGAAAYALLNRIEDARRITARLRALYPRLTVRSVADLMPLRRPADLTAYLEGLRRAGLPEK